jgi:kojibiose phosphorylase
LKTSQSGILAGLAEMVDLDFDGDTQLDYWDTQWCPSLVFTCQVGPGDAISGEKQVVIYTNREELDPIQRACRAVSDHTKLGFTTGLRASTEIWEDLWSRSNVVIEGDDLADRALRYNLFQILVAAPRHDDTVSIGAKTLSGYGYRGHVFWDTEIFILPLLIYTQPKIARNLLMYRYHTLAGARKKAKENGYQGAMYVWESASTGEEVTPSWVIGPDGDLIKIWCGEIEQHITADVVYGIHQYWQATGDDEFMRDYGVEIILSAGQFYASRLRWEAVDGSYHMRDVIGPDEYHEHVDDNAMTNLMAAWTLKYARKAADWMGQNWPEECQDLLAKLALTQDEILAWEKIRKKVAVHKRKDGVIEQFEGYFDLIYLDQLQLEPRDQSLQSLFGIDGVQQYQFIKQPDVVMAQYLLRDQFTQEEVKANMAYYSPRTDLSHGSSLGPSIQALMLARTGEVTRAEALFLKTLLTDLENNRGNTPDGIHAASAGAVWQVLVMGFAGMNFQNDEPQFDVNLPTGWKNIRFKLSWRNETFVFDNFRILRL